MKEILWSKEDYSYKTDMTFNFSYLQMSQTFSIFPNHTSCITLRNWLERIGIQAKILGSWYFISDLLFLFYIFL